VVAANENTAQSSGTRMPSTTPLVIRLRKTSQNLEMPFNFDAVPDEYFPSSSSNRAGGLVGSRCAASEIKRSFRILMRTTLAVGSVSGRREHGELNPSPV
jgi:hypothetical protein